MRTLKSANAIGRENAAPIDDAEFRKTARDLEAVFIAQMLAHTGLDDALTKNGGQNMDAFSSFYLEALSTEMAEQGGFGLAEQFYEQMVKNAGIQTEGESLGKF